MVSKSSYIFFQYFDFSGNELGSMTLVGPFQVYIFIDILKFYDSMK